MLGGVERGMMMMMMVMCNCLDDGILGGDGWMGR